MRGRWWCWGRGWGFGFEVVVGLETSWEIVVAGGGGAQRMPGHGLYLGFSSRRTDQQRAERGAGGGGQGGCGGERICADAAAVGSAVAWVSGDVGADAGSGVGDGGGVEGEDLGGGFARWDDGWADEHADHGLSEVWGEDELEAGDVRDVRGATGGEALV